MMWKDLLCMWDENSLHRYIQYTIHQYNWMEKKENNREKNGRREKRKKKKHGRHTHNHSLINGFWANVYPSWQRWVCARGPNKSIRYFLFESNSMHVYIYYNVNLVYIFKRDFPIVVNIVPAVIGTVVPNILASCCCCYFGQCQFIFLDHCAVHSHLLLLMDANKYIHSMFMYNSYYFIYTSYIFICKSHIKRLFEFVS